MRESAGDLLDVLRLQIVTGALQPQDRLREIAHAKSLKSSRAKIRDVFARLEHEGLVEARPNAGVRVANPPSAFKRRTLVAVRRTLETSALEQAFAEGIDPLRGALSDGLPEYRRACRKGDLSEVVRLDMSFHRTIVASADDGALLDLWLPTMSQMLLRYSRHHALVESYDEHAEIVRRIGKGDRVSAVRSLRQHIV